jgi:hypothetical protein
MAVSTRHGVKRSIGLAVALVAASCHRTEEKPAPAPAADAGGAAEAEGSPLDRELTWETATRDASIVLRQKRQPDGFCHLEAIRLPDQKLWSGTACVGKWIDLRFLSDDGERIIVLHPYPKAATHGRATPFIHVYQHEVQVEELLGGGIVQNWSKVRTSGSQLYWVAGVLDLPGTAPHYSQDGSGVELDTLDGARHRIPFAPPPRQAPPPAPAKRKAKHHR